LKRPHVLLIAVALTACTGGDHAISLVEARGQLRSPKPLHYLTQTLGAGADVPGDGQALWYRLAGPDAARRLTLHFDANGYLDRATVMSAGPDGRYDQVAEVLFDRAQWPQRAPATP
jgi:hypothetical protein